MRYQKRLRHSGRDDHATPLLNTREEEKWMQASFGSATGRMSKPGKTSSTISKRAGSKRLAYGSAMAIKRCWVRSRRNLGRLPDNAVWFTRWTMCESLIPNKQQEQIKPEVRALFYQESCLLLFYAVIRSLKFNKLTMPASFQAQPDPELFQR